MNKVITEKKILRLLFFLAIYLSCLNINAQNYPIVYQLKTYYSTSLTMRIDVVTQHLGKFILTPSRFWLGDNRPRKTVFCADDGRAIIYNRPETCRLISWEISFYREPMEGLGGRSKGEYYFNNNQWLLKESNNFPRFENYPNALVCINAKNCVPLPEDKPINGELFLIWGKTPTTTRANNLTFNFFTDKLAESIDKQALLNTMVPHLEYLNKLFNYSNPNPIKVVMIAKNDGDFKDAGGTAADDAFLINYYVKNGQLMTDWEKKFIGIFLHEYVHIITPCNKYPRWACESLADYYSYKALTNGEVNTKALVLWGKYKDIDPNYQLGLYAMDQRYKQTGSWEFYKLFYLKGASFWNELDLLLHKKNQNLDNFIPLITIDPSSKQIELPKAFTDKMIEILGEEDFKTLTHYYL